MAGKDVEVIIRAKDRASAIAEKVSNAFKGLGDEARGLTDDTDKAGSGLDKLGASLAKLQSEADRIKGFAKLVGDLNKSEQAVDKMDAGIKGMVAQLGQLDASSATAAANLGRLQSAEAALNSQLDNARGRLKAVRDEQERLSQVTKDARADRDAYNKTLKTTPDAGAAQKSAGTFLRGAVADAAAATSGYNASSRELVRDLQQEIKSLGRELRTLRPEMNAAVATQKALANQTTDLNTRIAEARAQFDTANDALEEHRRVASTTGASLGGLAADIDQIADAEKRLLANSAQMKARLQQLEQIKAGSMPTIPTQDVGEGRNKVQVVDANALTQAVKDQRKVMLEARKEWIAQQAEVKRLAGAMKAAAQPSEELATALGTALGKARAAKSAFQDAAAGHNMLSTANARVKASSAAVAAAVTEVAQDIKEMSDEAKTGAANIDKMDRALRNSATAGRQTTSMLQRIKSEITSLTMGYVGLYGAIEKSRNALDSQQAMDALTNRLGAAFDQDAARVGKEISWLRGEADRLGVSLNSLGDGYGRFVIAADAANFSANGTREIFTKIAEAGRVNKLSLDDMNGIYRAFEQIISKAKFSAEEVRGQLGDRLPGAFTRLAQSMGVTTAQLDDMMKAGEAYATEDSLIAYVNAITEATANQLPASLDSLAADIGRFQTDIFNAELTFSRGFAPAVREALQAFSAFARSREGHEFFLQLGQAAGNAMKVLATLPQHFTLIKNAALLILGVKLSQEFAKWSPAIMQVGGAFRNLTFAAQATERTQRTITAAQGAITAVYASSISKIDQTRASLLATTSATTGATAANRALAGALALVRNGMTLTVGLGRALIGVFGGIPGVIASIALLAVGAWITNVDEATSSLEEHRRQLDIVKSAYYSAGDGVDSFANKVKGLTLTEAETTLAQLQASYESKLKKLGEEMQGVSDIADRLNSPLAGLEPEGEPGFNAYILELDRLRVALDNNEIGIEEFRQGLNTIAQDSGAPARVRELAAHLLEVTRKADDNGASLQSLGEAMTEQKAIVAALGGDLSLLKDSLDTTEGSASALNDQFGIQAAIEGYKGALENLKNSVPGVKGQIDALNLSMASLNNTAMALFGALFSGDLGAFAEGLGAAGQHAWANLKGWGSGVMEDVRKAALSRNYEADFTAESLTPAGTDTKDMVAEAALVAKQLGVSTQDLLTLFSTTSGGTMGRLGSSLLGMSAEQQGKYGLTPDSSIVDQVRAAHQFLKDAGVQEGDGVLQMYARVRDGGEGQLTGGALDVASANMDIHVARVKGLTEVYGGVIEKQEELYENELRSQQATADTIAKNEFELSQQELINAGKGREAAIEKAMYEARAANPAITDEQLALLGQQAATMFDMSQSAKSTAGSATKTREEEERVNQLYELRQALLAQLKVAEETGNTEMVGSLKQRLEGVTAELQEAIQAAIAMHKAIGGPEADAAIAKLETMAMKAQDAKEEVTFLGLSMKQWGSLGGSFADGLVGVMDSFAQAVANGEDAVAALGTAFLKFAADFLRQIATMILKQMILNALQSFFPGIPMGHTGGLVGTKSIGQGNPSKQGSSPTWFQNATRYHTGGIAGLRPDEMGAVLQKNEEVLTEEDPRHRFNLGGEQAESGGKQQPIKQLLVIGEKDLANAMASSAGEQVVITHIKQNAATLRKILG